MSNSIIAIGKACSQVQAMPDRIRQAARQLGITPALRINGVEHFDETDVDRIGRFIEETNAAKAAGSAK